MHLISDQTLSSSLNGSPAALISAAHVLSMLRASTLAHMLTRERGPRPWKFRAVGNGAGCVAPDVDDNNFALD